MWISKELSDWAKEIFNNEAFAERMANTLNFVLKQLVGPECFEIKIKDPNAVHFNPKQLVSDLTIIYSNLQDIEEFCKKVVKDDRSFKLEYMNKALRVVKKTRSFNNTGDFANFV